MYLGVHRFAPNKAIKGDVGWKSSLAKRRVCALRLWNKLCRMENTRTCREVCDWDHRICRNDWCSDMKKLFLLIDGNDLIFRAKSVADIDYYKDILDLLDVNLWNDWADGSL